MVICRLQVLGLGAFTLDSPASQYAGLIVYLKIQRVPPSGLSSLFVPGPWAVCPCHCTLILRQDLSTGSRPGHAFLPPGRLAR